jgi:transmembrane sensor
MNIHEIIIRRTRGEADEEELAALRRWRAASAVNEAEYQEVSRVIRESRHLWLGRRGPVRTPVSAETIVRLAEERQEASTVGTRRRRKVWVFGTAAAAAGLVATILGVMEGWRGLLSPGPTVVAEARTGPGERRTLQLPDGTLVHLDERTRVEAAETRRGVRIRLEGRAYLGVARTEGRVTTVTTPGGEVEVLGTRFNVSARAGELEVLVVNGRVRVKGPGKEVEVGEGELTAVRRGDVGAVVSVPDPQELLGWMERSMVFQNTRLDQAVWEIERRFGAEIDLDDPDLAGRTITTSFEGESLKEVITIVCRVVEADCRVEGERVLIHPRGDGSVDDTHSTASERAGAGP